MARKARIKSQSGIYHIMLRGIDGRNIFLDEQDKTVFIQKLLKIKETVEFKLYGYCLMDNHVHILIKESEEIGTTLKRITVAYVQWHNNRYGRTGHLFQNRYLSEPVETEKYLLAVIRYIHQNPLKAMMVKRLEEYPWSSYHQYSAFYAGKENHIDGEITKAYLQDFQNFQQFMALDDHQPYLEYKQQKKYTDEVLQKTIQKQFETKNIADLPLAERNEKIKEIYQRTGSSIRQLARVLGVGKTVYRKCNQARQTKRPLVLVSPSLGRLSRLALGRSFYCIHLH